MLKLTLRNLFARKVRLVMSGLAIVLGVAFLSGVLVFSNGLSSTFDSIIYSSTPDGIVRPEQTSSFDAGGATTTQTISPEAVDQLAALPEVARADGDVNGIGMSLLASDGTLVGGTGAPTLAFNHTDGPNMAGEPPMGLTSGRWPTSPDEVVLDDAAADHGDYALGDEVKLLAPFGESQRTATLVGTAEFNGGGTAGATLLVFSTEGAQDLFLDGANAFNQVSLTAADGVSQKALAAAAAKVAPAGFEAVTGDQVAEESQDAVGQFLDVISTFLLVFAIIAVIVGGFIIVNTFTILVAQRSRELALLRALGASRRQVTQSVLLEALVMSALAATIGIGIGWLLARGLAALFRAVGLDISSDALTLDAQAVVISYAVGVGVTLVAAFLPARRAGKVAPVAAMRADAAPVRESLRRRTIIGGVLMAVGVAFAVVGLVGAGPGPDALWIGIAAAIWILTAAGISSVIGRPVLVVCRGLFGRLFGTTGRLAGENALRDPRRTGATASALMIGLALVSCIGVLATSLNASVDDVVDEEFTSDFLVQSTNFLPFSTSVGDSLADVDGVATVSRQQWTGAQVGDSTVLVTANDAAFNDIYDLDVVAGHQDLQGDEALVSKGFAEDHGLKVGSPLKLTFLAGKALDLEVAGIIEGSETTGDVSIPLDLLAEAGVPRQDTSLSIMLEPGADPVAVGKAMDEAVASTPIVAVYDKQEFAESIRDQVNQLLYMIYGLLALAIVIAVIGIVNTLGLSVIERTREIGLLRAIGMSRTRLRRMITLESVAIAVLGAVLGMALGLVIGVLLRQALKDDLTSLGLPLGQLLVFLVIAVVVGVLAAILPAIRASRLNVLEAIATE
ncbi:ABC transporter permease [Nocardioides sp. Root1257]|uniref:ABC transporter permease n=1 Tax=unclassified Nocardioides TaxID=2615069 RepID=UPI0006F4473B|nr:MULTISPECIES: FtsX-like permease family protein [unclassified Nocardioides]KQW48673.1 ABC transporter permease [Nocardioides sp. Root1257]KRC47848.1 ABC transporter permease [Nocardioides sp. Root224]